MKRLTVSAYVTRFSNIKISKFLPKKIVFVLKNVSANIDSFSARFENHLPLSLLARIVHLKYFSVSK